MPPTRSPVQRSCAITDDNVTNAGSFNMKNFQVTNRARTSILAPALASASIHFACPAAAASHSALLPPLSTAAANCSIPATRDNCARNTMVTCHPPCSAACSSSSWMAAALPQCAATCRQVAPLASVWARAVGQQEQSLHAARTCGECDGEEEGGWVKRACE